CLVACATAPKAVPRACQRAAISMTPANATGICWRLVHILSASCLAPRASRAFAFLLLAASCAECWRLAL
ncbi:hypothetical protein HAX54_051493, partial [Datura stramonium]|nr:hypothetical protein [Datura stramonium]